MKMSEPLLKDNIEQFKWNFIFYKTFLSFYDENSKRKTVEAEEIAKLADLQIKKKPEQKTMSQFTVDNLT